jgi:K+-sensing histidine kinase KdpD
MRLDTLINNILVLSQIDAGSYPTTKEELNFSDLVMDVVQQFKGRYPDRSIDTHIAPEVTITGDALLLKLLVSNLLENANKYSVRSTTITCELGSANNKIVLKVADEGLGIAVDEKKMVFEKFYRIGNEQTRKTQGTGLGLYLCKKIAVYHHGDIGVTDNKPQGSIFAVSFDS